MTFYCLIGQEMLNFVTNCCKLLKVNQAAKREVSSTVYDMSERKKQVMDHNIEHALIYTWRPKIEYSCFVNIFSTNITFYFYF